jgi:hypothetical protein
MLIIMFKLMVKSSMMMICTSIAGHFAGLPDTPVQCRVYHPIEEVQDFTRSHWMRLSGKNLLCTALAAARVGWKKSTKNAPYLLAVSLAMVMFQYDTKHIAQWRGSRATWEATG